MNQRIAVIKGHSTSVSAAVALLLTDLACVEVRDREMPLRARPELPDHVCALAPTCQKATAWYQQFTGKRGRPRRY